MNLAEIRGPLEGAKARAAMLEAELAGLAPLPEGRLDRSALEARVGEWRALLRGAPQRARQILRDPSGKTGNRNFTREPIPLRGPAQPQPVRQKLPRHLCRWCPRPESNRRPTV